MELATAMLAIQTLVTAIQTLDRLKSICSVSDFMRELAALQSTVNTIKSVMQDAEANQDSLNDQEKKYIQELKDAIRVVDEFLTLVNRKNLTDATDKLTDKVRSFFTRFKLKLFTSHLFDKVKQVGKKLDTIIASSKSSKFRFKINSKL